MSAQPQPMRPEDTISETLLRIWLYLLEREGKGWVTVTDIVDALNLPRTTTNYILRRLTQQRIVEAVEYRPAHHYRVSPDAKKNNKEYIMRLEQAKEIFGGCGK